MKLTQGYEDGSLGQLLHVVFAAHEGLRCYMLMLIYVIYIYVSLTIICSFIYNVGIKYHTRS